MDDFLDLVRGSRSYRRFDETVEVPRETLLKLVEAARLAPSSGNLQPLKFMVICDRGLNARVFPCLRWAGFLKDWEGPGPGERPSAYVLVMTDESLVKECGVDVGIAVQTILLGARAAGFGGCMLASVDWDTLRRELGIHPHLRVRLVVALGKPVEKVAIEQIIKGGSHQYWRDEQGVHHVPKRSLEDILVEPSDPSAGLSELR